MPTQQPMSDSDIRDVLPGIRIYMYRELAAMAVLPRLPFVLLYETSPHYGHWVAVLETPQGIEHFDSYGYRPDDELSFIPKQYRRVVNAGSPQLVRLLLGDPRQCHFSEFRLQKDPAQTCGRWCVARISCAEMDAAAFARAMRGVARGLDMTPDTLVATMVPPA